MLFEIHGYTRMTEVYNSDDILMILISFTLENHLAKLN